METRNEILKKYISNSFLKDFDLEKYTDVTYNGENLIGETTSEGRCILIDKLDNKIVGEFLIHIAQLLGKNFNTLNPILDITFLRYRLSAVHPIISKNYETGVYTFSIRIYTSKLRLNVEDYQNFPLVVQRLLKKIVLNKMSILISGITGSGKTELQKHLVSYMPDFTRIVIIEDTYESFLKELYPKLDVISWVTFNNQDKLNESVRTLVKAALRNNPDWLIISEIRSEEAKEVFTSLTTGHPLITTIHALNASKCVERFASLMDIEVSNISALKNLIDYVPISIHMKKLYLDNKICLRIITEIVENTYTTKGVVNNYIYTHDGFKPTYYPLSQNLKKVLGYQNEWYE